MNQDGLQTENGYKPLIVLGGVFLAGLLCVSAVLLYAAYERIIDGGTASLGASLLLVVLTGACAFLTLWMSYETKRSRQQAIKPVLEFRPREYRSTIVNLGNRPARNTNLTLTLKPKGESHHVNGIASSHSKKSQLLQIRFRQLLIESILTCSFKEQISTSSLSRTTRNFGKASTIIHMNNIFHGIGISV